MNVHIKILAAFHLVLGFLGLMDALAVFIQFGGAGGAIGFAVAEEGDAWTALPIIGIAAPY